MVAGGVDFVGGLRVAGISVTPSPARPGEAVTVRMTIEGSRAGYRGRLGLRSPRSASREEVRPQPAAPDPRDRLLEIDLAEDGPAASTLELPAPWHPATVIVDLAVTDARGAAVVADRGARSADGRAFLAVVPVLRRPTAVIAGRGTPVIDGDLGDRVWDRAPSVLVGSRDGEPVAAAATEVWFAWDPRALYVAARLADDDLWSDYTAHDDPLYRQEAFEIFVAGDGSGRRYLEYQVSPRGVTLDARFPRYRQGDEAWDSAWETAVIADGTVDDPSDRDRGWAVEVAIPWAELCAETTIACPVGPGTRLRINTFRLERPGREGSLGLALSPTLRPDFHAWDNAAELELQ